MTISHEQQSAWIAEVVRLDAAGQRFTVELDAGSVLTLVSHIQLACRRPGNTGPGRDHAIQITRDLQAYVAGISPAFAAMLEAGWHPEHEEAHEEEGQGPRLFG